MNQSRNWGSLADSRLKMKHNREKFKQARMAWRASQLQKAADKCESSEGPEGDGNSDTASDDASAVVTHRERFRMRLADYLYEEGDTLGLRLRRLWMHLWTAYSQVFESPNISLHFHSVPVPQLERHLELQIPELSAADLLPVDYDITKRRLSGTRAYDIQGGFLRIDADTIADEIGLANAVLPLSSLLSNSPEAQLVTHHVSWLIPKLSASSDSVEATERRHSKAARKSRHSSSSSPTPSPSPTPSSPSYSAPASSSAASGKVGSSSSNGRPKRHAPSENSEQTADTTDEAAAQSDPNANHREAAQWLETALETATIIPPSRSKKRAKGRASTLSDRLHGATVHLSLGSHSKLKLHSALGKAIGGGGPHPPPVRLADALSASFDRGDPDGTPASSIGVSDFVVSGALSELEEETDDTSLSISSLSSLAHSTKSSHHSDQSPHGSAHSSSSSSSSPSPVSLPFSETDISPEMFFALSLPVGAGNIAAVLGLKWRNEHSVYSQLQRLLSQFSQCPFPQVGTLLRPADQVTISASLVPLTLTWSHVGSRGKSVDSQLDPTQIREFGWVVAQLAPLAFDLQPIGGAKIQPTVNPPAWAPSVIWTASRSSTKASERSGQHLFHAALKAASGNKLAPGLYAQLNRDLQAVITGAGNAGGFGSQLETDLASTIASLIKYAAAHSHAAHPSSSLTSSSPSSATPSSLRSVLEQVDLQRFVSRGGVGSSVTALTFLRMIENLELHCGSDPKEMYTLMNILRQVPQPALLHHHFLEMLACRGISLVKYSSTVPLYPPSTVPSPALVVLLLWPSPHQSPADFRRLTEFLFVPGYPVHALIEMYGHQAQLLSNFRYDFTKNELEIWLPRSVSYDNVQVLLLEVDFYYVLSVPADLRTFQIHSGPFYIS